MFLPLIFTSSSAMRMESAIIVYLYWNYQRIERDRNLYTSIALFFSFLSIFIIRWCHWWLGILSSVVFRWKLYNDLFFSIIGFLILNLIFTNASILILFIWMKSFTTLLVFISNRGIMDGWTDLLMFLNLIGFCILRLSLKTKRVSGNS